MQETKLTYAVDSNSVTVEVQESSFSAAEICAAAYELVGRCFVHLTKPSASTVSVRLTPRQSAEANRLGEIADEFAGRLGDQRTRVKLAQSAARIREYYTAAALRSAAAALSIDDLLAELDSEELLEDPLEISVPWEEKKDGGESAE